MAPAAAAPEIAQHKPELIVPLASAAGREHGGLTALHATQMGASGFTSQTLLSSRPAVIHSTAPSSEARLPSAVQPEQSGDPRTLSATSNSLEVGVASSTHGWLRVRAELDQSGVVTAAVVAASASSAETLTRHLPEMSAYLAQESTKIGTLVVHASDQSASGSSAFAGMGQFGGGNAGQNDAGQNSAGRQRSYLPEASRLPNAPSEGYDSVPQLRFTGGHWSGMSVLPTWQSGAATHWVSVRV